MNLVWDLGFGFLLWVCGEFGSFLDLLKIYLKEEILFEIITTAAFIFCFLKCPIGTIFKKAFFNCINYLILCNSYNTQFSIHKGTISTLSIKLVLVNYFVVRLTTDIIIINCQQLCQYHYNWKQCQMLRLAPFHTFF